MPSIRYTRDKRGYETTYVVHGYRPMQGPGRTRVLYLFRSPSHATVGRRPLDDEARVALEHTHPDVSFDWQALSREIAMPRERERDRDKDQPSRSWREIRAQQKEQKAAAAALAAPMASPARAVPAVVVDDQSMLGRTLGAAEAARLRGRYAELMQRIARRARSPEERDQLTERAQRLNPDDWTDERAVRAGVSTVEAEWDTLSSALPQRRRGRRGGRRRDGSGSAAGSPSSAIIASASDGDADEISEDGSLDRTARDSGADRNDDGLGTGAEHHDAATADRAEAAIDTDAATADGVPGGD